MLMWPLCGALAQVRAARSVGECDARLPTPCSAPEQSYVFLHSKERRDKLKP